jgi:CBS domain-containing protein/hemerythrin-like domain-containing protein
MLSCDVLKGDHALIGEVLRAVEDILDANGRADGLPVLAGAIEFFGAFVERCHEAKEERGLFPVLASLGILDAEALRTMQCDHREAGRLLQALRPFVARRTMAPEARHLLASYVTLQRHHMAFEDVSVFPRAEHALSAGDDAQVREAFERIEESAVGHGGRDVLVALAGALTRACHTLKAGKSGAPLKLARDVLRPIAGTVSPGDSLSRAREVMASLGARELPVVEREVLVGILTRTDMEPHQGHFEWTPVRTAMSPDPVVIAPDASIRDVARLLLDHGFNGVPVVNGRLLGMIRRSDLLEILAADDGH